MVAHKGGTIGSWAESPGDVGVYELTSKSRPAHGYPNLEPCKSRHA